MTPIEWFVLIVSIIMQIALAPSGPPKMKVPTIDDVEFPQAEEGTPQIVVFGDVWIKGWTVLSYGDFSLDQVTAKGGGK